MNSQPAPLTLGTRASPLALAQTDLVAAALRTAYPGCEIRIEKIRTTGDHRMDVDLATGATPSGEKLDKGLFTKELEAALFDGRIDAAVHSLKDLPGEMPLGLALGAVLPRAADSDLFLGKVSGGFDALPSGAVVATSSERRRLQALARRPDLRVVPVRGNVGTRLSKLRSEISWHGMILARAGLDRLGFDLLPGLLEDPVQMLHIEDLGSWMLPAAGQGAIAVQIRAADPGTAHCLAAIHHTPTALAVTAERALLRLLGGGCHLPVGVRAAIRDMDILDLDAVWFHDSAASPRRAFVSGFAGEPAALARTAFNILNEN